VYLGGAAGQADSAAFLVAFERRMHAWRCLFQMLAIALLAFLFVLVWLPVPLPGLGGRVLRMVAVIGFTGLSMLLAFGVVVPPMRWFPARVRRYWFRDLPPEAERFRDTMIAVEG